MSKLCLKFTHTHTGGCCEGQGMKTSVAPLNRYMWTNYLFIYKFMDCLLRIYEF